MEERGSSSEKLEQAVRGILVEVAEGRSTAATEQALARLEELERERFGGAVARIAAYDPDPAMRHRALSFIFASMSVPFAPRPVREAFARSAGRVLLEAFEGGAVDDDRRWFLGPMMELCGVRLPSDRYAAAFDDFEAAHRRMVRKALDRFESVVSPSDP